jgi:ornithine carbamoyltransferase
VGDGRNNVARSLMLISAKLGVNFTVISPPQLFPDAEIQAISAPFAQKTGAKLVVTDDTALVKGADCVYTDVWVSMGEEDRRRERAALLAPYQVNDALMGAAENPRCIFMHCLPAVKGEEVTHSVIEGPASRVWDQGENRKHTIKAIMLATI